MHLFADVRCQSILGIRQSHQHDLGRHGESLGVNELESTGTGVLPRSI